MSAQPQAAVEPAQTQAAAEPAQTQALPENDIVFVSHEETNVSGPAESPEHDSIFSDKSRKAIDDAFAGLDEEDEKRGSEAAKPAAGSATSHASDGSSVEAVFERAVRGSVDPLLHSGWTATRTICCRP